MTAIGENGPSLEFRGRGGVIVPESEFISGEFFSNLFGSNGLEIRSTPLVPCQMEIVIPESAGKPVVVIRGERTTMPSWGRFRDIYVVLTPPTMAGPFTEVIKCEIESSIDRFGGVHYSESVVLNGLEVSGHHTGVSDEHFHQHAREAREIFVDLIS